MKITHLSTFDTGVGAAIAAHRLHSGLRRLGVESTMFALDKRGSDPGVLGFVPPHDPLTRLRRWFVKRRIRRDLRAYASSRPAYAKYFSDDRSEHGSDVVRQLPPADIYALHWVSRLVDYRTFFFKVSRHTPIVWRMSDMVPFTGGCHYDFGCNRFTQRCGACPQLGSKDEHDLSAQVWRRKAAALARVPTDRLQIVALNRWMAEKIRTSSLLGRFPVTVIPNSLDVKIFSPTPRDEVRNRLGIDPQAVVLIFVASDIADPFKGLTLLIAALKLMEHQENIVLLTVGRGALPPAMPVKTQELGFIADDRQRALAYSAADVFVIPSTQDNLPSTVLEAMACGVPIVGFNVGGIPDMMSAETGLLVPPGDVAALAAALDRLIGDPARRAAMSVACRHRAVTEYDLEVQARRFIRLFEDILGKSLG